MEGLLPIVAGEWGDGKLSNGGENITVLDKDGNLVLAFNYDNNNGWPGRADGKGSTLEVIDPAADLANPENWRSSSEYGGTPGSAGEGPATSILINEVLAHTDVPVLDTIELHNPTDQIVDISHWYLTDSSDDWKNSRFPPIRLLLQVLSKPSTKKTSTLTASGTQTQATEVQMNSHSVHRVIPHGSCKPMPLANSRDS